MEAKKGTEVIRADDFVEYSLFPSLDELSGNNADEKLENFLREVNESVQKFTIDYIWHKEPFQLVVRTPDTSRLFHATKTQGMFEIDRFFLTEFHIFIPYEF